MNDHPFRSLGRLVLAACAVSLSAVSLGAQKPAAPAAASETNPSRVDIFLGYSYFGAHGRLQPAGIPYSSVNEGVIASGAYYHNRYLGGEAIYTDHPDGANDGVSGISLGPIVRYPMENFTLFAHGLVGTGRLGGPNCDSLTSASGCNPATVEHEPYRWGVALTAGGGADYDVPYWNNRFSLRVFEVDYRYLHNDFGPYVGIPTGGILGGRANLSAVELSAGIVTHFGHITPPVPVSYSCSVSPSVGFPGDPITVTGVAMNLNPNPKKIVTYTWSSDGGTISGTSSTATVNTATAAPGTYTVKGHVSQGLKPGQMADCSATFTVRAFDPPTISCSANPSSVNPGASSTITASAVSPQNRPLTYSYNATAGSISGTTPSATLSTVGAAPGPITVTCGVSDDKGHSLSARTSVNVIAPPPPPPPPPPPAPMASSLCSVSFERDAKRPTRVDNEAKACLDDVALALQRSSDARLALVGNEDAKEQKVDDRLAKLKHNKKPTDAAARAVNTKDYLVAEKGIDSSRILVYTGTDDGKTVTTTLIPVGASNPVASDTAVDESAVKAVPRTAVKKAAKKK
jgi:hypothetical protein